MQRRHSSPIRILYRRIVITPTNICSSGNLGKAIILLVLGRGNNDDAISVTPQSWLCNNGYHSVVVVVVGRYLITSHHA